MNPLWIVAALGALGAYAYYRHLGPFCSEMDNPGCSTASWLPSPALLSGNPISVANATKAVQVTS